MKTRQIILRLMTAVCIILAVAIPFMYMMYLMDAVKGLHIPTPIAPYAMSLLSFICILMSHMFEDIRKTYDDHPHLMN